MKKTISAVAVLALAASLAIAGDHGSKGERGHGKGIMSERLAEKLNLSEVQTKQMRDLHEAFRAENQPARETMKQTKREMHAAKQSGDTARMDALKADLEKNREAMKQRHEAQHQRFLSILTAEQRVQLETMKKEKHEQHSKGDKRDGEQHKH